MKNKKNMYSIMAILGILSIFLYNNLNDSYAKPDDISSSNIKITNNVDIGKDTLEIYYLDVGQADSILIRMNNHNMLIDAGNNSDGPLLVKYFQELGISNFDYVIGTHAHEDHIGGMDDIINSFTINHFYMPDALTTTITYEDVLDSLASRNVAYETPNIGSSFTFDNCTFKILYLGTDSSDLNNTSIVIKLIYQNTSYLFMGDATKTVENQLDDVKANVIKIGHHGSNYSSGKDFINKVNPQYAIISVGIDNKYNHPADSIINLLKNNNISIYRTDQDHTIYLVSDGTNININKIKTEVNGNE